MGPVSDQGEVWDTVHENLGRAGVRSASSAMTDLHRARGKAIDASREALRPPKEALGVVFARGDRVLGMDLFDSHKSLQRVWDRLSGGSLIEALGDGGEGSSTAEEQVRDFLARATQGLTPEDAHIGAGTALFVDDETVSGTGVWYEGRLCHVSAFPAEGEA